MPRLARALCLVTLGLAPLACAEPALPGPLADSLVAEAGQDGGIDGADPADLLDTRTPDDLSLGAADCQAAWSAGLSRCDLQPDDYVVVRKSQRNLSLCKAGAHLQSFRVGLGFNPAGDKVKQGDGKTPEGVFYIPRLVPDSSYYKAFLLSYPDRADAERGLAAGLISQAEKDQIDAAQDACLEPPYQTGLGGLIEIHGRGGDRDWTAGCIAVEDPEVDILWGVLEAGDTIVVLP